MLLLDVAGIGTGGYCSFDALALQLQAGAFGIEVGLGLRLKRAAGEQIGLLFLNRFTLPAARYFNLRLRRRFFGVLRFEAFLAAFGAFFSALNELGSDQFDHGLLRAITLAEAKANDAGIATCPLPEA